MRYPDERPLSSAWPGHSAGGGKKRANAQDRVVRKGKEASSILSRKIEEAVRSSHLGKALHVGSNYRRTLIASRSPT